MTTEWKEITTLQELAQAQADGWGIECCFPDTTTWIEWSGARWKKEWSFRGRPSLPKMKKVKSLCWRYPDGDLAWREEGINPNPEWERFPAGDIEGEVEDD